jgi:hypothetical protein
MRTVSLNDNEFYGNTSRPGTALTIDYSCQRCGSSLAKRREETLRRRIAGIAYNVERFRCRCGRRREVRRAIG